MRIAARLVMVSGLAALVRAGEVANVGTDGNCKVGKAAVLEEDLTFDTTGDDIDTSN
jgi:hypothetical protein